MKMPEPLDDKGKVTPEWLAWRQARFSPEEKEIVARLRNKLLPVSTMPNSKLFRANMYIEKGKFVIELDTNPPYKLAFDLERIKQIIKEGGTDQSN